MTTADHWRIDPAHGGRRWSAFSSDGTAWPSPSSHDDRRLVAERIGGLAESFDLAEPFGRIREAIEEARRGRQAG